MAQIRVVKAVRVCAKTILITVPNFGKMRTQICDEDGNEISDYTGYGNIFFPVVDHGSTLSMEIDIDTGKIVGWEERVTPRALEAYVHEIQEEERRKAPWEADA